MNDEVKDMISRALDNEPPLRLGYDEVHAAGRRRLTRRNLGIVSGTALAVVAVASTAVAFGQLNASPSNGPAGPPTTSTTQTAPPQTAEPEVAGCTVPRGQGGYSAQPQGQASDKELAESARLTAAFRGLHLPVPPGVSVDNATARLCVIKESWGVDLALRSAKGERALFLEVRPSGGQLPGECNTFGGQVECARSERPDGTVVVISATAKPEPNQPVIVNVEAWRADGTRVSVMETGPEGPNPAPRLLDDDALAAIATAPELKVNWTEPQRTPPAQPSERRAAELTAMLAANDVLPPGVKARKAPRARVDAMAFYVSQGGYKLNADLTDSLGEGNLFINLSPAVPGVVLPVCAAEPRCELRMLSEGRTAQVETHSDGTVSLTTLAADGTQISITARNESQGQQDSGAPSARLRPPLGIDDLVRIASLADLHW